jgi:hypothetical protein
MNGEEKRNLVRFLAITLASGARFEVSHVMLYHGPSIERARELNAEAIKNLQGVSTGIGFWGSPGWVLGGALALRFVEQAASSSAAKRGIQQLKELEAMTQTIRDGGQFIPVGRIDNIHYPIPSLWLTSNVEQKYQFVKEIQLLGQWNTQRQNAVWWMHSGEPYIRVKVSDGTALFLAWDKVEQYSVFEEPQ